MVDRYKMTVSNVTATAHGAAHPEGEYVLWRDYEALRAEVERLNNVDHNADVWCERATKAEVEVERLTGILRRHNDSCDEACRKRDLGRCEAYLSRGRTCVDCPMDEKIDFRLPDPTEAQRTE